MILLVRMALGVFIVRKAGSTHLPYIGKTGTALNGISVTMDESLMSDAIGTHSPYSHIREADFFRDCSQFYRSPHDLFSIVGFKNCHYETFS